MTIRTAERPPQVRALALFLLRCAGILPACTPLFPSGDVRANFDVLR